jgi:hypothetical protein
MSEDKRMRGCAGLGQEMMLRSAAIALCNRHESQETVSTERGSVRVVGAPWVCCV